MPLQKLRVKAAVKVALVYLFFALVWIIVSDEIVLFFFDDNSKITFIQTIKGWVFVSASAAIIYFLLLRELKKLEVALKRVKAAEETYGKVLQSATSGILITKNNLIVYANQYVMDITGLSTVQVINNRLEIGRASCRGRV